MSIYIEEKCCYGLQYSDRRCMTQNRLTDTHTHRQKMHSSCIALTNGNVPHNRLKRWDTHTYNAVTRYYTDKWQLITAHSNSRSNPSPETTASAVLVGLVLVTALAQVMSVCVCICICMYTCIVCWQAWFSSLQYVYICIHIHTHTYVYSTASAVLGGHGSFAQIMRVYVHNIRSMICLARMHDAGY